MSQSKLDIDKFSSCGVGGCQGKSLCYNSRENMPKFMMYANFDQIGGELTVDERNLLSVAYKNVVGTRRASWRIISSIEQKEETKGSDKHVTKIKEYRDKIEKELEQVCGDVLNVLDDCLIPKAESGESKVFYHKMCVQYPDFSEIYSDNRSRKGDYHRYLAEFASGDKRKEAATAAHEAYKASLSFSYLIVFIIC